MENTTEQTSSSIKLDLGCGIRKEDHPTKQAGFIGVDLYPVEGVDIEHDLSVFPWPFEDNSVDEIYSSHFLEHFDGDTFIKIMEECYRILKPKQEDVSGNVTKGKMTHTGPYWSSVRAIQDPTHKTALSAERFLYFNKEWREANGLSHYTTSVCDFDFVYAYHWHPDFVSRTEEVKLFAANHYVNAITDITVTCFKK